MLYGYSGLARELNRRLDIAPPVSPRLVYMWNKRGIRNRRGYRFPEPDEVLPKATAAGRVSRYRWELEPVVEWVLAGIPVGGRRGWRYPARRGINSTEQALRQVRAHGGLQGEDENHDSLQRAGRAVGAGGL